MHFVGFRYTGGVVPPPTRRNVQLAMDALRLEAGRTSSAALNPVMRTYEAQLGRLIRALGIELGDAKSPMQAIHLTRAHSVLARHVATAYGAVARVFVGEAKDSLSRALEAFARVVRRVRPELAAQTESRFGGPAARRVLQIREEQLAAMRARSFGNAATSLNRRLATELDRMALERVPMSRVVQTLGDEAQHAAWQIERVVRTETSAAFNQTQVDGMRLLLPALPQLEQRWTELVDDATGRPLDSRVAVDSIVMHGQITPVGDVFTMPSDPRAPGKLVGVTWSWPPNRPNDRAIVMPWHPEWRVPAYRVVNLARVPVTGSATDAEF